MCWSSLPFLTRQSFLPSRICCLQQHGKHAEQEERRKGGSQKRGVYHYITFYVNMYHFILTSLGAPAQDLPKFQMPCLTPKSVQTCSIHSPDGDRKVSLKKIDPFMINGCHIVASPDVTSD